MNDIDVFEADLNGQDLQIAIVQARFNLPEEANGSRINS